MYWMPGSRFRPSRNDSFGSAPSRAARDPKERKHSISKDEGL